MKKTKLLSLLTAGVIVLSGFNGLALNSGIAHAATTITVAGATGMSALGTALTNDAGTPAEPDTITLEKGEAMEIHLPVAGGSQTSKLVAESSGTLLAPSVDWTTKGTDGVPVWNNGADLKFTVPADAPAGHMETVTVKAYDTSAAGADTLVNTYAVKVTVNAGTKTSRGVTLTASEITLGGNGKTTAEISLSNVESDGAAGFELKPGTMQITKLYREGTWADATAGWAVTASNAADATEVVDSATARKALSAGARQISVALASPGTVKADKEAVLYVYAEATMTPNAARIQAQKALDGSYTAAGEEYQVTGFAKVTIKITRNTRTNQLYLSEKENTTTGFFEMEVASTDQTIYEVSAYVSSPDDPAYKAENVKYTWRTTNTDDFTVLDTAAAEAKKILTQEEISTDTSTFRFYVSDEGYAGEAYIWCTAVIDGITKVGPRKLVVTVNPGGSVNAKIDKDTITRGTGTTGADKATMTLTKSNGAKDEIKRFLVVANGAEDIDLRNANTTAVPGKGVSANVPGIAGLRMIGSGSNTLDIQIIGKTAADYYDIYLIDGAGRYGVVSVLATYEGAIAPTAINLSSAEVLITTIGDMVTFNAEVVPNKTDARGVKTKDSVTVAAVKVEVSDPTIAEVAAIGGRAPYGTMTNGVRGVGETTSTITLRGLKEGTTTVTVYAYGDLSVRSELKVTVSGATPAPKPEPEKKAGDAVSENGVNGILDTDLTVIVTGATVAGNTLTIPETIEGYAVTSIQESAFKRGDYKVIHVRASVNTIGKAAWKASKAKKIYFYQPAALTTVGKNAMKKTNAKALAVGGSFTSSAASQLKKAGATKVKNNATVAK